MNTLIYFNDVVLTDKLNADVATLQKHTNDPNISTNISHSNLISELQTVHTRIDTIENATDEVNAAIANLKNNTDHTMTTVDRLIINWTSQEDTLRYLNETVVKLNVLIQTNKENNASSNVISKLSQLEADMNSSKAIIQDYATRITGLESGRTINQAFIMGLDTEIIDTKYNLTSAQKIINDHDNKFSTVNESVLEIIDVINQINSTSQAEMERLLARLETDLNSKILRIGTDIEIHRASINDTNVDIENLEDKYQHLRLNLINLENETTTLEAELQNSFAEMMNVRDQIRLLNGTFNADRDLLQHLTSNLTYLDAELDAIIAATRSNTDGISSSVVLVDELERETSKLDTLLTDVIGDIFI